MSRLDPPAFLKTPTNSEFRHWKRLDRMVGGALRLVVCVINIPLLSVAASSVAEEVLYEQKLEPYPFPILLPATIGGKTYIFEFDTGADIDFVDSTLKPSLGTYRGNERVVSLGRSIGMEVFDAPAIMVRGWRLPFSKAGVSDMNRFRSLFGVDIRGFIGVNAVKDCSVFLDFDHRRMRILRGNGKTLVGMESLSLLSPAGSRPSIKCSLQGKDMEFLIDTGASNYLGLQHEAFDAFVQNGTIEMNGGRKIGAETGAGRIANRTGNFTRGKLLGVSLTNTPVHDTDVTNIIGMGFLLNLNSVIDLKNSKLFYQSRKIVPPIYKGALLDVGITFPGCRNYIYWLDPFGPAAKAGLEVGDHIVRLGPLLEADINAMSIYKVFFEHAGEKLEIRVQRAGENKATVFKLRLPERELLPRPMASD